VLPVSELSPERLVELSRFSKILGHRFFEWELLNRALTHCSYANENGHNKQDNERFEFLGDAVLELVVTHLLCDAFPERDEGELSKIRASSVNKKTLSKLARKLDMGAFLLLSKGEQQNNGGSKSSILADTFEAVLGAIYLDGGLEAAFHFVAGHFVEIFENLSSSKLLVVDFKTRLQEYSQAKFRVTPRYKLAEERGPDHEKEFVIDVSVKGDSLGSGSGPSKKEAEQRAAAAALKKLGVRPRRIG
jgi:ribonuclease III